MNQFYPSKIYSFKNWMAAMLLLCCQWALGQVTISTESGNNYNNSAFVPAGTAAGISFVIENTNAQDITLTQVDHYLNTDMAGTTFKLWYSATSLSGAVTLNNGAWTQISTGLPLAITANGIGKAIGNIYFPIPAGARYRFVLESSSGLYYSGGANVVVPTPNTFSASSVNLRVGDNQISNANVGYAGPTPTLNNNPRFFTGRIQFLLGLQQCPEPAVPTLSADTTICSSSTAVLRVTGGSLNGANQWRWYSGNCGGIPAGSGTTLSVSPNSTTTYYVRGEGGCATPASCGSVTINVNTQPATPIIDPIGSICLNSVQQLVINPVATVNSSVSASSGPISINVPDNVANGPSNTLTLPALPAGATITNVSVRINMEHTYIGDMIFNLRAPNGSILNLVKYLGANPRDGEDFVNTIISSTGTATFSATSSVAPFTGTFKADAINTVLGANPVQNPTGFVSNATSFANLTSVIAGNWTLAMADGGPADVGILKEWAITVNYRTTGTAYPAVWSPASTLYTDAAATVPYDGVTPVFSVYAKPSVTTTYSAVSKNLGCSSPEPATVQLTVNNPVAIEANGNPVNTAVCENGNMILTIKALGTSPSYQWQTDSARGTFVNVENSALITGANKDTLSIAEAPTAMNGFKFRCIVTSLAPCTKQDTSVAVTLTVNPTPTVALSAAPYTKLLPGITTTISASSTPAAATYTWYRDGNLDAANTAGSITINSDGIGVYKAAIVDVNGCTNTTGELSITDSVSSRLFIYPNPTNGQFSVSYYSIGGNVLPRGLMIYDSKGALVLNQSYRIIKPYAKMDVNFSALSKGIYMVVLIDQAGKRLASGKVAVQ